MPSELFLRLLAGRTSVKETPLLRRRIVWEGPTFVRAELGLIPTPEEDGFVLVRLTATSPELDLSAPISCDWRPGDEW